MRISRLNISAGAVRLATLMLAAPAAVLTVQACTDLGETPTSAITPSNYYKTEAQVLGGLAGVYAGLRGTLWGYYNISQVSTDENVVPTRGQDWYDNGVWLELHRQAWGANSSAGLDIINGTWNDLFTGVARANATLEGVEGATVPNKEGVVAELRALRAYYYYGLMDIFGGVPIITTTKFTPGPQASRDSVFRFVEAELLAAREALPLKWDEGNYGRLTQGAADAILANMYLNAQVFTGTVSTAGLQPGAARWQDAVTTADRILNSGAYSLNPNWRANFTFNNQSSPENIMVVRSSVSPGLGINFLMRSSHYSQLTPSPWNGFATLAETYYSFDAADVRRQIFLVGPQVNLDTGAPVYDRAGNPLVFTPQINDITNATEGEGARIAKWSVDPNHVGPDMGNDYNIFRLAEIYLIKAEALNELGQTAQAVQLVNTLRARVYTTPQPLSAGSFTQASFRTQLLTERLHELTAEAKRRQDMIRFGVYTMPFAFKSQTDPYRILFPIPQTQLQTNPHLVQNPGY